MHIAHASETPLLSVEALAQSVGLKRRQIANLAKAGEIPGVRRAGNGYHFEYPDTPELRLWIKKKRRLAKERAQPLPGPFPWYLVRADVDMQLPRKLAVAFHEWNSWMRENQPFHGWEEEKLRELRAALVVFNTAYEAVGKFVKYHEEKLIERARDGMPLVRGRHKELIRLDALSD